MQKGSFLYDKNSVNKMLFYLFLALLPCLFYGFYKNGIILYEKNLIGVGQLFKPLLLPLVGLIMGLLIEYFYLRLEKDKKVTTYNLFNNINLLDGFIVGMIIPVNTNILLFLVLFSIFKLLCFYLNKTKKIRINNIALIKVLFMLVLLFLNMENYLNIYESTTAVSYTVVDMFFGKYYGGVCSTSVICVLIGYLLLCFTKNYKKEIPFYLLISYGIIALLYYSFTDSVGEALGNIFTNSIVFASVFIAPISLYSCYTLGGKIIYSILIAILTFAFSFIIPHEAIFIAIIIVSLINQLIDSNYLKIKEKIIKKC